MWTDSAVRIGLVLPDLLGTYGDGGNAEVLLQRLRWRGVPAEAVVIRAGDGVPACCDVYVLGGGEDDAQRVAARHLRERPGLQRAVATGGVVLAVCAGLQILGERFTGTDGAQHAGLAVLDLVTTPLPTRAVGEIVALPDQRWCLPTLTGFENHRGATTLGPDAARLAAVLRGVGNGDAARTEGVVQGRIVGTYLHGPVLARNPELADLILGWATGDVLPPLAVPAVDRLRAERLDRQHRR